MKIQFDSDDVRNLELAIVAVFTGVTTLVNAYGKRAARLRDEKRAKLDAEAAKEVADREQKKAEFNEAVAAKVQEVKTALEESTTKSTKAICEVKDEVIEAHGQIDKVHTIVNSEKTRMLEDMVSSRLLNLSMAKSLLEVYPSSESAKKAVDISQELYDRAVMQTQAKRSTDQMTK